MEEEEESEREERRSASDDESEHSRKLWRIVHMNPTWSWKIRMKISLDLDPK